MEVLDFFNFWQNESTNIFICRASSGRSRPSSNSSWITKRGVELIRMGILSQLSELWWILDLEVLGLLLVWLGGGNFWVVFKHSLHVQASTLISKPWHFKWDPIEPQSLHNKISYSLKKKKLVKWHKKGTIEKSYVVGSSWSRPSGHKQSIDSHRIGRSRSSINALGSNSQLASL